MNPRRFWEFITSRFGLFLVFLSLLVTGLWAYGHRQGQARQVAKQSAQVTATSKVGQVRVPLEQGLENRLPQPASSPERAAEAENDGKLVPFRPSPPPAAAPRPVAPPVTPPKLPVMPPVPDKPKPVRYRPLLANYQPPVSTSVEVAAAPASPPERFLPFGTLLKCQLVNTVDSANIDTPVIALLLEDVWQNGRRVIPANTLLHGTARAGRIRDRVNASGTWRFVWQDGRELPFGGIALDREYDHGIDGYGITDGSAGIKGRLLATDDYQELKMLAAAALSGFARGTQDRSQSALGSTISGSLSNGVREGVGEVFDLYAERTLRDIETNGHFVRVAAGKEFYVYVLQSVLPEKAQVAGTRVEPDWSAPKSASIGGPRNDEPGRH